jgi:hypothetical protein
MLGRVRRAVAAFSATPDVRAGAILHVYNPEVMATVLTVGLGSAGVTSPAIMARTAGGRRVAALGAAATGTIDWAREKKRYVRMPGRVLVLVTSDAVVIREWTVAKGTGRQLARWPFGTFTATKVRYVGLIGVRVVLHSGRVAVLTGRHGLLRRGTRAIVDAIDAAGHASPARTEGPAG